jgi:uncharacterized protein YegL
MTSSPARPAILIAREQKEDINMKKDLTELVFILDRSGSMSGLESDTIGGYNTLLQKQKAETGDALITTVLFDDRIELLHDRIGVKGVQEVTEKEYFVRGSTALLDAIGYSIDKIVNTRRHTSESEQPEKTMFVITTDGYENASKRFTYEQINHMITREQEKYGWEFLFIGANMDAVATAQRFGIHADRASTRHNDAQGTQIQYDAVNCAVSFMRTNKSMPMDWSEEIDKDYKAREKK